MMKLTYAIPALALLLALSSRTGLAQQADDAAKPAARSPTQADPATAEREKESRDNVASRLFAMEATIEQQSKEIAELKAESGDQKKKNAELEEKLANVEDDVALIGESAEDVKSQDYLSVFGFFDLSYFKGFWDKDSIYNMYLPAYGTFAITNANIYFRSQMTNTLGAIAEIRFSFLPHGYETQYEAESVFPDGSTASDNRPYDRVDTTVRDPITTIDFQQGGVTIERIHLTYTPFDWLGIIAGRFLTPYGIWNIDHGSPVVLPARIPNLVYRQLLPQAQTGLQLYGRVFPTDRIFFDYALTLSNGRGPTEALVDLDENKGLGLRLKLTYSGRNFTFFTGTYGYTGEYTDIKKRSVVQLNPDLTQNRDADKPLATQLIPTEAYREYAISYDISFELFGVLLQSEAVWRRVDYSIHPEMLPSNAIFNGASATDVLYQPDYLGYGVYVLLAYTLPVPESWGALKITPFVFYERGASIENVESTKVHMITWGLNVKPSPFVTLKGEGTAGWADSPLLGNARNLMLQMAVSF